MDSFVHIWQKAKELFMADHEKAVQWCVDNVSPTWDDCGFYEDMLVDPASHHVNRTKIIYQSGLYPIGPFCNNARMTYGDGWMVLTMFGYDGIKHEYFYEVKIILEDKEDQAIARLLHGDWVLVKPIFKI
jgi:hypothetical protein